MRGRTNKEDEEEGNEEEDAREWTAEIFLKIMTSGCQLVPAYRCNPSRNAPHLSLSPASFSLALSLFPKTAKMILFFLLLFPSSLLKYLTVNNWHEC